MEHLRNCDSALDLCARRARELRESRGLSIEDLLERCDVLRVWLDETEYRDLEAGRALPRNLVAFLDAVSLVLQLDEGDLFAFVRALGYAALCERLGPEFTAQFFGAL